MARCIQEGHLAIVRFHVIRADVLCDTASLASRYACSANMVEK